MDEDRSDAPSTTPAPSVATDNAELHAALAAAGVGAWEWDLATGKVTWSDNLAAIFGLPSGSFAGTYDAFLALVHPADRDAVAQAVERTLRTAAPYDVEFRLARPDGDERWIAGKGQLTGGAGEAGPEPAPARLLGVAWDVTARRQAEAALRRSEQELADFFERAAIPLSWVGPDGTILRANQAELDLLGFAAAEYVGHHIAEFHVDQEVAADLLAQLRQHDVLRNLSAQLRRRDGSPLHVLIDSSVRREGREVAYARLFTRDVTARRQAEARLAEQMRQQAAVADLGRRALTDVDLDHLLGEAIEVIRDVLAVDYVQVLELHPDGRSLRLRAGTGWRPGVVGQATVGAGSQSPAGYTLLTDEPVIVADLATEPRFAAPPHLREHGIVSGVTVVIRGRERPFGVLGAHTNRRRDFSDYDTRFLRSIANVLAAAVERRRIEAAYREASLGRLVEHAADVVKVVAATGDVRYVSPAVETVLGYTPAELVGTPWSAPFEPEDEPAALAAFTAALTVPGPHPPLTVRVHHRDGSRRWLELRLTNHLADPGIVGIVVNARDVTERKQAEAALSASEARYRDVVESQSELVCRYLPDTTLTFVNEAYGRYFGQPAAELIGTRFLDLIPALARETTLRHVESLMAYPRRLTYEHEVLSADGSVRWQQWVDQPILDAEGAVVEIQGIGRDITERKEAEQALRRSEASLAEAQRLAHLGSWELDLATGAVFWSNESYRIFDVVPGSVEITEELFQTWVHPADRERLNAVTGDAVARGGEFDWEIRIIRPDGEERVVNTRGEAVRDGGGAVVGLRGTNHDVTEQWRAEAAMRASEARFRALVQHASDLVAVIGPEGTVTYLSPAVERLLGYAPADLIGDDLFAYAHPEDEATVRRLVAHTLTAGIPSRPVQVRIRHRDSTWRWLEVVTTNLHGDPAVGGVVVNARDVTERKNLEDALWRQAFHDPLTGLPNRALLRDRVAHALERGASRPNSVAVLFLDLDNFKLVNDGLGHPAGDRLLVAASQRFRACLRPTDTLARFGGDEFVVLLEDLDDPAEATGMAERLTNSLAEPLFLVGYEVPLSVSVGVALARGDDRRSDELLREADVALYRAKSLGVGRFEMFDPSMREQALARLELGGELRRALDRGEFSLRYQPMVDLGSGRIAGLEALVYWEHPERGLIPPNSFIPVAEEMGLIVPLGRWVLGESCRQLRRWVDRRIGTPLLWMSVNVSVRQFQHPDLAREVATALGATGLEPDRLQLELTESAVMADEAAVVVALERLRSQRIRLTIDDFGTGYASLTYLRRLPVDGLKIDRSFVAGLTRGGEDAAIVEAVVRLGRGLGLEVTAEGVETVEQAAALRAIGCDRAQGYLFGRPQPSEAIESLLEAPPVAI